MRHFTIDYTGHFRLANSFRFNGLTFRGGLRKYAREHGIAGALLCSGDMLLFERDGNGSVRSKTLKEGTFTGPLHAFGRLSSEDQVADDWEAANEA